MNPANNQNAMMEALNRRRQMDLNTQMNQMAPQQVAPPQMMTNAGMVGAQPQISPAIAHLESHGKEVTPSGLSMKDDEKARQENGRGGESAPKGAIGTEIHEGGMIHQAMNHEPAHGLRARAMAAHKKV